MSCVITLAHPPAEQPGEDERAGERHRHEHQRHRQEVRLVTHLREHEHEDRADAADQLQPDEPVEPDRRATRR